MFVTTASDKEGIITIRPANSKHRFPAFDVVEVDDKGMLRGFGGNKPSNLVSFNFGPVYGEIEVLSWNDKEVVYRIIPHLLGGNKFSSIGKGPNHTLK